MSETTCWTLIEAAGRGESSARRAFADAYFGIVRRWLRSRWRGRPLEAAVEDAVQDVFYDCLKAGGALERSDRESSRSFRPFLRGVAQKIAQRYERRDRRGEPGLSVVGEQLPANEEALSRAFDRAWASELLTKAARRQLRTAQARGRRALRRVEILRARFDEDLPVRAIAERFGEDAAFVHHEYAVAREEFKEALRAEIALLTPGPASAVDRECEQLLDLVASWESRR